MDREGRNYHSSWKSLAVGETYVAVYILAYSNISQLWVLNGGDFNFCVRSTPLQVSAGDAARGTDKPIDEGATRTQAAQASIRSAGAESALLS